jgi:hypothetical protein
MRRPRPVRLLLSPAACLLLPAGAVAATLDGRSDQSWHDPSDPVN